jgi:hypothetical protein
VHWAPIDGGRDRTRAIAIAEQARDELRATGHEEDAAAVERRIRERVSGKGSR